MLAVLALLVMACEADAPTVTDTPAPATPDTPATPDDAGDVDEAVLDRLATAAGNTADEGTARFTIEARSGGTRSGAAAVPGTTDEDGTGTTDGDDTGTADDDAADDTGTTDASVTVEGQVDFDQELREMQFTGPQGQLTAVVDGDDLYVQLPATEEGEFARIDLDQLADAEVGFGGPAGIPFQDPQRTLDALRDAVVEARVLDGDPDATPSPTPDATATPGDDLDATPTPDGAAEDARHLLVVIDLQEAAASADARHFAAMAEQYGIETVDMEVWIDEQDRIEQVAYTLPLAQARIDDDELDDDAQVEAEVDPPDDLVVTITYHDFGAPVDITVPDEEAVIDVDEQQLRGSLPDAGTATPHATPTPTPGDGGDTDDDGHSDDGGELDDGKSGDDGS